MAVYAAQISSMDQNIGKLINYLNENGKLENSLIIFLSDNGACPEPYEELGGGAMNDINDTDKSGAISYGMGWANASNTPYRRWKRELEEGGIATPLIMHWPKGISKNLQNTTVNTPSYLIDIMPTFMEVAKAKYPTQFYNNTIPPLEGRSIAPQFQGKEAGRHPYMYWEHEDNQAIRKGNWKAVKDGNKKKWELFDLSSDRNETKNVASQRRDILQELERKWEEWANTHYVFPKRKNESK